jgi:hypothetical protein
LFSLAFLWHLLHTFGINPKLIPNHESICLPVEEKKKER